MIGFLGFEHHMLKSSDPMAYQFILVSFKIQNMPFWSWPKKRTIFRHSNISPSHPQVTLVVKSSDSNDILHTTDWSLSVGLQGSMRKKTCHFFIIPLKHPLPALSVFIPLWLRKLRIFSANFWAEKSHGYTLNIPQLQQHRWLIISHIPSAYILINHITPHEITIEYHKVS